MEQSNKKFPTDTLFAASSENLSGQYQVLGKELLRYEASNTRYSLSTSEQLFVNFRTGVAFISTEVLQAYLEDLLDLEVAEDDLNIKRKSSLRFRSLVVAAVGLITAIALGMYATSLGASLPLALLVTVILAIPFGVLWHLYPREGLARRMGFAQIVSYEISRRRGVNDTDKNNPRILSSSIRLGELLSPRFPRSAEGAAFSILQ